MRSLLGQSRSGVRRPLAVLLLVLAALLAACSNEASPESDGPGPGGQNPDGREWPTGEPLDTAVTSARDHVVRLGDGTKIDTGDPFHEYVVAGDAVWFTKADPAHPEEVSDDGRLWRATRDGVEPMDAAVTQMAATEDGRYLVFLDDVHGPQDDYGKAAFLLVVVDTETGVETVRSSEGMDEAGPVGLEEAYEDGSPWLVSVTDGSAYVKAMGTYRSFDLATGDVEVVDEGAVPGLPTAD